MPMTMKTMDSSRSSTSIEDHLVFSLTNSPQLNISVNSPLGGKYLFHSSPETIARRLTNYCDPIIRCFPCCLSPTHPPIVSEYRVTEPAATRHIAVGQSDSRNNVFMRIEMSNVSAMQIN